MDRLGHDVLAGAALAFQQHGRRLAGADLSDQLHHVVHRLTLADQLDVAVALSLFGLEPPHIPPQSGGLQRLLDDHRELVEIDRLGQVVEGPELHRLHGALDRAVGGHHHHRDLRLLLPDPFENLYSGGIGQAVVQHQQVAVFFLEQLEGGLAGLGLGDLVPLVLEPRLHRPADQLLVLDDQDVFLGHHPTSRTGK